MAELRRSTEARQAELIDAALHIIATRGIAALTTRSLAEHVGLTGGAIFRHFASIDALIEAVVGRVESVMESTFPPSGLPPGERLDRFVEARSTAVGGQVGIMQLMLSEQFLLALRRAARRGSRAARRRPGSSC
jgi:AcrR family transcriptional regulator